MVASHRLLHSKRRDASAAAQPHRWDVWVMNSLGKRIIGTFENNIGLVDKLANFDRIVLHFAISSVDALQHRLKKRFENERLLATSTLTQLRNIRNNDSMRPQYEEILNQCVVLLVSHFGSAVSDIFKEYVTVSLSDRSDKVLREELKFTIGELCDCGFDLSGQIGEIIALKKDISFQDMKSISCNFETFLGVAIERDKKSNNIILGQACRHVIVHSGAIADARLIRQVSGAIHRDLKEQVSEDSRIQFTVEEIKILGDSMLGYLNGLVNKLDAIPNKASAADS